MSPSPDPGTVEQVDEAQHDHAARVAREGAELARSLGFETEPHVVPDEVDVMDALLELAREQAAAAVVVGQTAISGLRSRVMGSVARKLIQHSDRAVLVGPGEES